MPLFSKIRTVSLAYANTIVDKVIDENSIPVVKQHIRDIETARDQISHESAVASANVKILQQNIDGKAHLIELDKKRASDFLAQNNEPAARAVASRIHDEQTEYDSLKEQMDPAQTQAQQMQTTLQQLITRHDSLMSQLRRLESEDHTATALHTANSALKSVAALTSNDVNSSVDNVEQKIHQRNMVETEEFNQTMASMQEPPDPEKDAAVDDILNSLRPTAAAVA